MSHLARLQQAAEQRAGVAMLCSQQRPLAEPVLARAVGQGVVTEFFAADRRRVYAWMVERPEQPVECVAFVQRGSSDSPVAAVRSWLSTKERVR